jgi:hypothetical protein
MAVRLIADWLKIVTGYLDSAARNLGHTEQPQVSILF